MLTPINSVDARQNFSEFVNQAAYGNKRIVLYRRSKPVAALISLVDLDILESLDESCNEQLTLGT